MQKTQACIRLSAADRATLNGLVSGRNTPQKVVWRSRIVLLLADRLGVMAVARSVGMSKVTVGTEAAIGVTALNWISAAGRPTSRRQSGSHYVASSGRGLSRLPSVECTNASVRPLRLSPTMP